MKVPYHQLRRPFFYNVFCCHAELSLMSGVEWASRVWLPKPWLFGVVCPLPSMSSDDIELLLLLLRLVFAEVYFLNGSSRGPELDLSLFVRDSELSVRGWSGVSLNKSLLCISSAKNRVLAASSWLLLVALGMFTSGLGGGNFDTGKELQRNERHPRWCSFVFCQWKAR